MAQPAGPTGIEMRDAKRALRNRIIAVRDALNATRHAELSRRIAERIASLPSWRDARTPLLTLAYRSEWDTMPLVRVALAAGKSVAAPRVDPEARMLSLHFIVDPDADLAPGFHDIPEPRDHCPRCAPEAMDWVLVPGVAFDRLGRRLGYGGGFYDRLLPHVRTGVPRIAGAFDFQVVDNVPAAPHDLRVDAIVTEERLVIPAA